MNIDSYNRLCRISERFQPRKFGRICQKLLALALRSAGYDHVVEREVQGVDVDAARIGGPRYSIEVKTTKGPTIALSAKDFECLRQRLADNYLTVIAVLRLSPLGDWIAIDSTKVRPGSYLIDKLSAYSIRHLESEMRSAFGEVLRTGRGYLGRTGQAGRWCPARPTRASERAERGALRCRLARS